jgi:hypothetical protein
MPRSAMAQLGDQHEGAYEGMARAAEEGGRREGGCLPGLGSVWDAGDVGRDHSDVLTELSQS